MTEESSATTLCKACGLCCSGHLFIWVKLRPSELDPAQALGMQVMRSDPNQRGFNQPCPLWDGQCTIYTSRHYPHACRAYKCKLLKEVIADNIPLEPALGTVETFKQMVAELEPSLPPGGSSNFRERLVAQIEHPDMDFWSEDSYREFRSKAEDLLAFYVDHFGVTDLLEPPGQHPLED